MRGHRVHSGSRRARTRAIVTGGLAALALTGAGHAFASADLTPPPSGYKMPGVAMRIEPSQISAGTKDQMTFSVALTRKLAKGTLELTLPRTWRERSPDGKTVADAPATGSASSSRVRVRRFARVVRFSFTKGRRNDTGTFTVADRALAPGTYRPTFRLRVAGQTVASGSTSVVVLLVPTVEPVP